MSQIFSNNFYQDLWNKKNNSGNRKNEDHYLEFKAQEQALIVNRYEKNMDCIDLGCGAGELLKFLISKIKIKEALDFSEKMIELAKKEIEDKKINFIQTDPFLYLPKCTIPIWLTTGALNQYLDQKRMDALLEIFTNNHDAKSFYLFDCIDPIRFQTLSLGTSYLPKPQNKKIKLVFKKITSMIKMISYSIKTHGNKKTIQFKNRNFGYGYLTSYWQQKALEKKLDIEIISSFNFEYRYHVILKKNKNG